MSREAYVELVQDLCDELGLGEPSRLLEQGVLQVNNTRVGLEYLEDRDEVRLLMDLGEIEPELDRGAMIELLLEANLANTSFCLPTFSLHPETGHPIVAYHLPISALIEEEIELASVLTEQLMPLREEWNEAVRGVLDVLADAPAPGSLRIPPTLA